jgi:hypothetical protein
MLLSAANFNLWNKLFACPLDCWRLRIGEIVCKFYQHLFPVAKKLHLLCWERLASGFPLTTPFAKFEDITYSDPAGKVTRKIGSTGWAGERIRFSEAGRTILKPSTSERNSIVDLPPVSFESNAFM